MKRGLIPVVFLTVIAMGFSQSSDPLQVRWGNEGRVLMEVIGIDAQDRLRLSAQDGSAGEALVPMSDLKGLQFVLPAVYDEARQRAFVGRPAEAIFLLRDAMPKLAPYAFIDGSNASAAVQFYLTLLINQREWAEAIALSSVLVERPVAARILPELIRLVRGLQAEGRIGDAAWLVGRLPLTSRKGTGVALIHSVADEMRRAGHWAEAQTIYQRLRDAGQPDDSMMWDRLIAYTDWHRGSALRTGVLLQSSADDSPSILAQNGLHGLLQGRFLLAENQSREALDVLSQTLIGIAAASEWRTEITAVIAAAYDALGETSQAELIRTDLRRMHPNSLWVSLPET